jgi:hypothetical protein
MTFVRREIHARAKAAAPRPRQSGVVGVEPPLPGAMFNKLKGVTLSATVNGATRVFQL